MSENHNTSTLLYISTFMRKSSDEHVEPCFIAMTCNGFSDESDTDICLPWHVMSLFHLKIFQQKAIIFFFLNEHVC